MVDFKDFRIAFSGLKLGYHNFELSLGTAFFKEFEALSSEGGDLKVDIQLEKQERMLIFDFNIQGTIDLVCDRCLEVYAQKLNIDKTLYVKLQSGVSGLVEESDDVILIPDQESDFDVSQYIYEFISLALPMRRIHGVDDEGNDLCNLEMIELLEERKSTPEENEKEIDPRWDALKKLKKRN